MSDDNKDLRDDLNDMLGDAKDGAKKAAGKGEELAKEAKEKASEFAKEAKDSAKEFVDEAKDTFEKSKGENKKVLAGILGILLGALGVHKFILGYQKEGFILLGLFIVGVVTSCIGIGILIAWIPGLIGLIEGIIYLTKSDEDFYNTYQVGRKPWF
ncbi:MAG: NINE protein [Bacteroidia bacterium]|nr:NINE protein [Bacteroidia bacterium]NNK60250.1 NINE protein [Flavobacteriaceae bacterium]